MNDVGGLHRWSDALPLGVEVRATAWSYGAEDAPELYESTFYRYEVVNRRGAPIDSLRLGFVADVELGTFNDDYVHTDSLRQMAVVYNGDDLDEGGGGYGASPPALGIDVLSGGAAGAMHYTGGGTVTSDPNGAQEALNYLTQRWKDGAPLRQGGDGYAEAGPRTRWSYSGDPVAGAFWSEENVDGQGTRSTPADRRVIVSVEPVRLADGERTVLDLGVLFAQGNSRLASVTALRRVSDRAQQLYNAGALAALAREPAPPPPPSLSAPLADATPGGDAITFAWAAVPGADEYRFEIVDAPDAVEPVFAQVVAEPTTTVRALELPLNRRAPLYWRVRSVRLGAESAPAEARAVVVFTPAFDRFSVVANAAGTLPTPEPAADPFDGFPTPGGRAPSAAQQTTGAWWTVSARGLPGAGGLGDQVARSYASFLDVAVREGALPHDFEMRFTGRSVGVLASGRQVSVPFELWDVGVGTPGDPADDVRLVPVVYDADGDRAFSVSESEDGQLATDGVSWHLPLDVAPGERGYLAWAESVGLSPRAYGAEVLSRITLVRQSNAGSDPPTAPERGTILRIESSSLVLPLATDGDTADALGLAVRPNPSATRATVGYRLAADGPVRLRVVDRLGREVAVLVDADRSAGEHRAALDTSQLAVGVYVVVLDAGGQRTVQTVTVVR